jgi:hypothetical protein
MMAQGGIMFTTTLRLTDDLALFLQETARGASLSVNAFLAQLLEKERAEARRRRLAEDWAAYAADEAAQDVDYALAAQGEILAEPPGAQYRADPALVKAPASRKARGRGRK